MSLATSNPSVATDETDDDLLIEQYSPFYLFSTLIIDHLISFQGLKLIVKNIIFTLFIKPYQLMYSVLQLLSFYFISVFLFVFSFLTLLIITFCGTRAFCGR